jgi:hypothetical protein
MKDIVGNIENDIDEECEIVKVLFSPKNNGIDMKIYELPIFPCSNITLQYELYLSDDFKPMEGGILPGICISPRKKPIFYLKWKDNYQVEVCLHLPTRHQSNDYYALDALKLNNEFEGDCLWRNCFKIRKGMWNIIQMHLQLNNLSSKSNAITDGILSVKVNEITKTFSKMIWRASHKDTINAIHFSAKYQGHNYPETLMKFRKLTITASSNISICNINNV